MYDVYEPHPLLLAFLRYDTSSLQADGFDVAGSFLLRALAKPSLNVDLALRMPSECLVSRDSLNHRYLDKRALYAGHLAASAMDTERPLGKLVDKVEVWKTAKELSIESIQSRYRFRLRLLLWKPRSAIMPAVQIYLLAWRNIAARDGRRMRQALVSTDSSREFLFLKINIA